MLNNPEQCIENLNLLGVTGIALRQGQLQDLARWLHFPQVKHTGGWRRGYG